MYKCSARGGGGRVVKLLCRNILIAFCIGYLWYVIFLVSVWDSVCVWRVCLCVYVCANENLIVCEVKGHTYSHQERLLFFVIVSELTLLLRKFQKNFAN